MISTLTQATVKTKVLLFLFFIAVVFTRFYNLEMTARFTQDESSDLARMKQYYDEKKITLVGPISSDQSKVFSSLTYYMVMPFAAAFDFTPVSPVYGMAFYGVITAILMLLVAYCVNPKLIVPAAVLIVIWYPLVEMSRWTWNPHLVTFWAALGLAVYLYRKQLGIFSYPLYGFAFGALFHHHYLSLLATGPFLLATHIPLLQKKQYKEVGLAVLGYVSAFVPFIAFDLRHPPGLFFGRYLLSGSTPHVESSDTVGQYALLALRNSKVFFESMVQQKVIAWILAPLVIGQIYLDLKEKKQRILVWVVPTLVILVAGLFLNDFQVRYIYPTTAFLLVWMLLPRKALLSQILAKALLSLVIVSSLLSIWPQLTVTKVPPDMYSFTRASDIIMQTIETHKLNNSNVAALLSPDSAPLAEKYRDYIRMRNYGLRENSEYDVSEHLFVVTTANAEELLLDKSFAMEIFKKTIHKGTFEIPNSEWKVIWFGWF